MRMRSDAKLVQLARRGSRAAAAELFARHWRAAWRAAYVIAGRREMADDVAQDAFERAFAALSRFDEGRPFGAWLNRIVVNRSLDLLRRERRLGAPDAPPPRRAAASRPSSSRRTRCTRRPAAGARCSPSTPRRSAR